MGNNLGQMRSAAVHILKFVSATINHKSKKISKTIQKQFKNKSPKTQSAKTITKKIKPTVQNKTTQENNETLSFNSGVLPAPGHFFGPCARIHERAEKSQLACLVRHHLDQITHITCTRVC